MASHPLTIMFWPESAYGPTNQCIGLASILHDVGKLMIPAEVLNKPSLEVVYDGA